MARKPGYFPGVRRKRRTGLSTVGEQALVDPSCETAIATPKLGIELGG